jgi:hypothetical protein
MNIPEIDTTVVCAKCKYKRREREDSLDDYKAYTCSNTLNHLKIKKIIHPINGKTWWKNINTKKHINWHGKNPPCDWFNENSNCDFFVQKCKYRLTPLGFAILETTLILSIMVIVTSELSPVIKVLWGFGNFALLVINLAGFIYK